MLEKYKLEIVFGLAGLFLLGCGVFALKMDGLSKDTIEVLSGATEVTDETKLTVDVAGSVRKPGVYEVNANLRLGGVVEVAGGLAEQADELWVAKNLNLAEKVKDGQKIFIPSKSESLSSNIEVISNKINLNSASQVELEGLNGVGPATAKKIIENRPYSELKELVSKKIIGQKVFDEISYDLSLW